MSIAKLLGEEPIDPRPPRECRTYRINAEFEGDFEPVEVIITSDTWINTHACDKIIQALYPERFRHIMCLEHELIG